ncbi:hypothetical protein OG824_03275 [Streptomyces prunicolor]|uniref:hypothetical protein n=1 Tax=Streptomyces prunicolor TaxID=67348 RepID=UPI002258ED3A|nr:hypothetical protein [Streptomyces prunicolor]MCX5234256.1 hypothetical protein [Streptomyces prunicolor]
MTEPPKTSTAPPGTAVPTMPVLPPQSGRSGAPTPRRTPDAAPARRTAFAEGVDRLRAAATTEPGRLRALGALLAVLVIAFGVVTAWQTDSRATAADDVLHRSQPLSSDAADIYRSLADANTMAATGYLAGLQETQATRKTYEDDIKRAASKLVTAAANTDPGSSSETYITQLNELLPQYKGLVESARANNRQGFPVGGAYLRAANDMMQNKMLPKAQDLYKNENARLNTDYGNATPYPWFAIALGLVALGGLAYAQRRNYQRTNRVLNHGLVAASAATAVVLLWVVVGHTVARAGLNDSYDHGVKSLTVLHDARIASLKARSDENLILVSRGSETKTLPDDRVVDTYDWEYDKQLTALAKGLKVADSLADDSAGREPVAVANKSMLVWKSRHGQVSKDNNDGDYQAARQGVIGDGKSTAECFTSVDDSLNLALKHETEEFKQSAGDGLDAMTGLTVGAAVLAALGAAGAVLGIGRRLSEYR